MQLSYKFTLSETLDALDKQAINLRDTFNLVRTGVQQKVATAGRTIKVEPTKYYDDAIVELQKFHELYDQARGFVATGDELENTFGTVTYAVLNSYDKTDKKIQSALAEYRGLLANFNQLSIAREDLRVGGGSTAALDEQVVKLHDQLKKLGDNFNPLFNSLADTSLGKKEAALEMAEKNKAAKAQEAAAKHAAEKEAKRIAALSEAEKQAKYSQMQPFAPYRLIDSQTQAYNDALAKLGSTGVSSADPNGVFIKDFRKSIRELADTLFDQTEAAKLIADGLTTVNAYGGVDPAKLIPSIVADMQEALKDASDLYGYTADEVIKKLPKTLKQTVRDALNLKITKSIAGPSSVTSVADMLNLFEDSLVSPLETATKSGLKAVLGNDISTIINKLGITNELYGKIAATGTTTAALTKGVDAFGNSISSLLLGISDSTDDIKIATKSTFDYADIYKYLGVRLEKTALASTAGNILPEVATFTRGADAYATKMPLITQDDSLMHLIDSKFGKNIWLSNDIKTKSARDISDLLAHTKRIANGINEIDDDILRAIAPDNWAQFTAQIAATNPDYNKIGMTAFNRDFDWTTVDSPAVKNLVERWQLMMSDVTKGVGKTSDLGGQFFSVDTLKKFAKANPTLSLNDSVNLYFDKMRSLLVSATGEVDITPLRYAAQQFVVNFTSNAYKKVSAMLPKTSTKYAELGALLKQLDDPKKLIGTLGDYIEVSKGATKHLYKVLTVTTDAAEESSKLGRTVYDAVDAIEKINNKISTGLAFTGDELRGYAYRISKAFTDLDILADEEAAKIINQVKNMSDIVSRTGADAGSKLLSNMPQIKSPVRFLDIGDSAKYIAGDIKEALSTGLVSTHMDTGTDKLVNKLLDSLAPSEYRPELLTTIKKAVTESIPDWILDLETETITDAAATGEKAVPRVVQLSAFNTKTGESITKFINNGIDNEKVLGKYIEKMGKKSPELYGIQLKQLEEAKDLRATLIEDILPKIGSGTVGGFNATNFTKVGGAFDAGILIDALKDKTVNWGTDLLDILNKRAQALIGKNVSMKLEQAAEMFGIVTEGATHTAGADVASTYKAYVKALDGTYDEILLAAAEAGDTTRNGLIKAGKAYVQKIAEAGGVSTTGNIDQIFKIAKETDEAADAAKDVNKVINATIDVSVDSSKVADAGLALGKALDGVADTAVKSVGKITAAMLDAAKPLSEAADLFNDALNTGAKVTDSASTFGRIKLWFKRMFNTSEVGVKVGSGIAANSDQLTKLFDSLASATDAMRAEESVNAFTGVVTKASKATIKAYSKASKEFFEEIIGATAKSLDSFDISAQNIKSLSGLVKYADDFQDGTSYLAYTVDPKNGIKLLTENVYTSGRNISDAIEAARKGLLNVVLEDSNLADAFSELKTAGVMSDTGKIIGTTSDELSDGAKALADSIAKFRLYEMGALSADDLDATGKLLKDSLDNFGKSLYIADAAGNTKFAGEVAKETISKSADAMSSTFTSVTKKLVDGIGTFGALDLVSIGAAGLMQGASDKLKEATMSYYLKTNEATADIAGKLEAKGYDLGKLASDSIYEGVLQAIETETLNTLVSNAIGTGVMYAIGGAVVGTVSAASAGIGALVSAGVSIAMSSIMDATGSNSDTNKYLGNYLKLLDETKGNVVDRKKLEEQLGYEVSDEEYGNINTAVKDKLDKDLIYNAKNNLWDRDETNKMLYGNNNAFRDITANQTGSDAQTAAFRIAAALGKLNPDDYGTDTSNMFTGDNETGFLTVKSEDQLKELEKVLGMQLELFEPKNIYGSPVLPDNQYYVKNENGELLRGFDKENMEGLEEYLDLAYEKGYGLSEAMDAMKTAVGNNAYLLDAINERYGKLTEEAIANLDNYINYYNEANGTTYTRQQAEDEDLVPALLKQMIGAYSAYNEQWIAQAIETAKSGAQGNVLDEGTTTLLWGANLDGILADTLKGFEEAGIKLTEGTVKSSTAFLGEIAESFVSLTTIPEIIKDSITGWQVDVTGVLGPDSIDFANLKLSAEAIDILASAGIQINSDGTITFMQAQNEGRTGAERDITASRDSFSDNDIKKLAKAGITINFETGKLNLDKEKIAGRLSAAEFALPDDYEDHLDTDLRKVIKGIGTITDDGFLQITNNAILSGKKTIVGYVNALMPGDNDAKIMDAFENIDALIASCGADTEQAIMEWADGVAMPSPIQASEVTPAMMEAFNSIGITFTECGEQFLMVMAQTGEHLTDGLTLIDADKWNSIDEELRTQLDLLGVHGTECGNNVMVDINDAFDKGIGNLVSLFIDKPEVWDLMPDTFKTYLEKANIVSNGEMLQIKSNMGTILTQVTDGWIAKFDGLTPATLTSLHGLSVNTEEGVLKVAKAAQDASLGKQLDGSIVVPFEKLPDEIKKSLTGGDKSLEATLVGSKWKLEAAAETAVAGIATVFSGTAKTIDDSINDINSSINKLIQNANSASVKQAQMNAITSEWNGLGKNYDVPTVTGGTSGVWEITYLNRVYKNIAGALKSDALKLFAEWKGVYIKGISENTQLASHALGGTAYDEMSLVGEAGRELGILPNGSTALLGSRGAELLHLPYGTEILNNYDTEKVLKNIPDIANTQVGAYASGTDHSGISVASSLTSSLISRLMNARYLGANAGVSVAGRQAQTTSVDDAAQHILERVLPRILSSQRGSDSNKPQLFVDTLIADDRGIRELMQRMDVIEMSMQRR